MRLCLPLIPLWACLVSAPDLGRPPSESERHIPPSPPLAPGPESALLYQQLYAGELHPGLERMGQRLRILAWFQSAAFTADQLESLAALSAEVGHVVVEDSTYLAEVAQREAEAYASIYAELALILAAKEPATEDQLAPFLARVDEARRSTVADGEPDPRAAHYAYVRLALSQVTRWLGTLPEPQLSKVAECRFFLAKSLGPFTTPGDYPKWLGTTWNGSDYASLRTGLRPQNDGMMNIGGLWGYEPAVSNDNTKILGLRAAVLVLFAIRTDGFAETLDVARGIRAVDDYTPAPAIEEPAP